MACAKIILENGVGDLIVCDVGGILHPGRTDSRPSSPRWPRARTSAGSRGTADERSKGADVVIGVSAPGAFTAAGVRTMAPDAIVFAMANPTPEVQPEEVWERRRDHGHRPQRLPEPDQQRARVPGRVPRRARRARARRSTRR